MPVASITSVISHWSTLLESFQTSPLFFYQELEAALLRRQIPQTENSRVDHREAGLLSANREYLRIRRGKLTFDICAAPFGAGFFISWWLVDEQPSLNPVLKVLVLLAELAVAVLVWNWLGIVAGSIGLVVLLLVLLAAVSGAAESGRINDLVVLSIPIVGWLYRRLFRPTTYFRLDSMQMFQRAVHNAVLEVIDSMTSAKGLKALSEADRKPIMRDLYGRRGA